MKVLFTLDYELFLGERTGSVENCLIRPMDKLINAVGDGVKFTIFADAVYLYMLRRYKDTYPELASDLNKISEHLRYLQGQGHDVQLHIHPHWYYSKYDGTKWVLDNDHYKLSDLTDAEASLIFKDSKILLDEILGKKTAAFRAGGFSAQPTDRLLRLFHENGIIADSSVCPGMLYESKHQDYNFTKVPAKDKWFFDEDICSESSSGGVEIPISTCMLSPVFWWKYVFTKLIKSPKHKTFGDGVSVAATQESIKERLTKKSMGLVTIDGYKISFLKDVYRDYAKKGHEYLCVIGHPKLATPYSVNKLKDVCAYIQRNGGAYCTVSDLL